MKNNELDVNENESLLTDKEISIPLVNYQTIYFENKLEIDNKLEAKKIQLIKQYIKANKIQPFPIVFSCLGCKTAKQAKFSMSDPYLLTDESAKYTMCFFNITPHKYKTNYTISDVWQVLKELRDNYNVTYFEVTHDYGPDRLLRQRYYIRPEDASCLTANRKKEFEETKKKFYFYLENVLLEVDAKGLTTILEEAEIPTLNKFFSESGNGLEIQYCLDKIIHKVLRKDVSNMPQHDFVFKSCNGLTAVAAGLSLENPRLAEYQNYGVFCFFCVAPVNPDYAIENLYAALKELVTRYDIQYLRLAWGRDKKTADNNYSYPYETLLDRKSINKYFIHADLASDFLVFHRDDFDFALKLAQQKSFVNSFNNLRNNCWGGLSKKSTGLTVKTSRPKLD